MSFNPNDRLYDKYRYIQDIHEVRPRMNPAPTGGRGSSREWGLYIQDLASDVWVDKYGLEKGYKLWYATIGRGPRGGAMFAAAEQIVQQKQKMLDDLRLPLRDYFERSYFSIWKVWQETQTGRSYEDRFPTREKQPNVEPEVTPEPVSNIPNVKFSTDDSPRPTPIVTSNSQNLVFEPKDLSRINGILAKARGSSVIADERARTMANSITSKAKAKARRDAALSLGKDSIARIFDRRANQLNESIDINKYVLTFDKF